MDKIKPCSVCGEEIRETEIHLCGGMPTLIHYCINDIEIKVRANSKQGVAKKWNAYATVTQRAHGIEG